MSARVNAVRELDSNYRTRHGMIASVEHHSDGPALVFRVKGGDSVSARNRAVCWLAADPFRPSAREIRFEDVIA